MCPNWWTLFNDPVDKLIIRPTSTRPRNHLPIGGFQPPKPTVRWRRCRRRRRRCRRRTRAWSENRRRRPASLPLGNSLLCSPDSTPSCPPQGSAAAPPACGAARRGRPPRPSTTHLRIGATGLRRRRYCWTGAISSIGSWSWNPPRRTPPEMI